MTMVAIECHNGRASNNMNYALKYVFCFKSFARALEAPTASSSVGIILQTNEPKGLIKVGKQFSGKKNLSFGDSRLTQKGKM